MLSQFFRFLFIEIYSIYIIKWVKLINVKFNENNCIDFIPFKYQNMLEI